MADGTYRRIRIGYPFFEARNRGLNAAARCKSRTVRKPECQIHGFAFSLPAYTKSRGRVQSPLRRHKVGKRPTLGRLSYGVTNPSPLVPPYRKQEYSHQEAALRRQPAELCPWAPG